MQPLEWDDALITGDAMLDREHKTLFDLVGQAGEVCAGPNPEEGAMRCLTAMYLYAKEHFFDEEGLMERIGYPERQAHAAMHKRFVEETHALTDACLSGTMNFPDLVDFLYNWLKEHIAVEDFKIIRHAREHGQL